MKDTFDAYLDADAICASTFVRHVEIHDTLGSTNDRAAELARDTTFELPALIAARHQIAGRGRGSNTWLSSDGALTFSILLEPSTLGITTANWPQLSLATAVAICDALADELNPNSEFRIPKSPPPRLAIKWPNDIMLDGAKVCGILIESPGGAAPAKDRLIIGIGINLNNSWREADTAAAGLARHREKLPNAVSLRDVTSRDHIAQSVLVGVLGALHSRMSQLATRDFALPSAWQTLCWLTEQDVVVESNGKTIEGICQGIDRDGALLVEDLLKTHKIRSGSVRAM